MVYCMPLHALPSDLAQISFPIERVYRYRSASAMASVSWSASDCGGALNDAPSRTPESAASHVMACLATTQTMKGVRSVVWEVAVSGVTSAPKGQRENWASFRCWRENGMPMMVMKHASPQIMWCIARRTPIGSHSTLAAVVKSDAGMYTMRWPNGSMTNPEILKHWNPY